MFLLLIIFWRLWIYEMDSSLLLLFLEVDLQQPRKIEWLQVSSIEWLWGRKARPSRQLRHNSKLSLKTAAWTSSTWAWSCRLIAAPSNSSHGYSITCATWRKTWILTSRHQPACNTSIIIEIRMTMLGFFLQQHTRANQIQPSWMLINMNQGPCVLRLQACSQVAARIVQTMSSTRHHRWKSHMSASQTFSKVRGIPNCGEALKKSNEQARFSWRPRKTTSTTLITKMPHSKWWRPACWHPCYERTWINRHLTQQYAVSYDDY